MPVVDREAHRDRNLATVVRAFEGIAAGSAEQMLANYTEDLVLELPYAPAPVRLEGKGVVLPYLVRAFTIFRFTLTIISAHTLGDGDGLVLEYTSDGHVLATGRPYRNAYVGLYWFRDGAISQVREYYNPVVSAAALA